MKFVSYAIAEKVGVGVYHREEQYLYDLKQIGLPYDDMQQVVAGLTQAEIILLKEWIEGEPVAEKALPAAEIKLLSPFQRLGHDVICLGLNYREHVMETAKAFQQELVFPQYPVYFSKRVSTPVGPEEPIPAHAAVTEKLDYEVELAVVIGKAGTNIPKEEAEAYIFGYTILNDISARDLQTRHGQWYRGKSLDGFTAIGPCLVHRSALPCPVHLPIRSYVNGELRQNGNTNDFIFDIPTIIHDLSQGLTLEPGDIIATGTPSGVGMGFQPPRFMKAGDQVICEIEGIGKLTNPIKS